MPLEQQYRAPEVCRLAGITYRQLDYWARTGGLTPSIRGADGPGTARLYSSDDVKRARAAGQLAHLGIRGVQPLLDDPVGTIQRLIEELESVREDFETPLEELATV